MKRVLTLSSDSFSAACKRLEKACMSFNPDIVLGIETGGRYVAEQMFADIKHVYVKMQRPSTSAKSKTVSWLISKLPRRCADLLRIFESYILARRAPRIYKYEGSLPAEIYDSRRILIVDDAVDSGATMLAVKEAVECGVQESEIYCASITVTTDKPVLKPDVSLYQNILIRFPWSKDAAKQHE